MIDLDDFDTTQSYLSTRKPVRSSYGMKKALGQHFLRDRDFARRIAEIVGTDRLVVEIGPGDGSLTQELILIGRQVLAIELDADLIPKLKRRFHRDEGFKVIPADAVRVDWRALAAEHGRLTIVGNLPYNVATAILQRTLIACLDQDPPPIAQMVFMFQKEVAERITASPGNKSFGSLTLLTEYFCRTKFHFVIPNDRFFPKPQVAGGLVELTLRQPADQPSVPFELFRRLVRGCFAQRRKVMRNSLRVVNDLPQGWEDLPIDWNKRPEELSFDEFVHLAVELVRLGYGAG